MKSLIFLIISLLCCGFAFADGFKNERATKMFSNELMEYFIKNEFQKGLDTVKNYWPMPTVELDSLANSINQRWSVVSQRFGANIGHEFIKEERIGNSFLRYFYLQKLEKHAIYWQITFYKPNDQWVINNILFNDILHGLYESPNSDER